MPMIYYLFNWFTHQYSEILKINYRIPRRKRHTIIHKSFFQSWSTVFFSFSRLLAVQRNGIFIFSRKQILFALERLERKLSRSSSLASQGLQLVILKTSDTFLSNIQPTEPPSRHQSNRFQLYHVHEFRLEWWAEKTQPLGGFLQLNQTHAERYLRT